MRKIMLMLVLVSLSSCASVGSKSTVAADHQSMTAEEKLQKISLITLKLHGMHESNGELDVLENEGLEKSDVSSIRRAIEKKIKQLTGETIDLIDAL